MTRRNRISIAVTLALVVCASVLPTAVRADLTARTDDSNVASPTGWFTYSGVSGAQVKSLLAANRARLTDIEPAAGDSGRWTVTMVKNSGRYAVPSWWWYYGLSGAAVSEKLDEHDGRLIHIQPYSAGRTTRFAAIIVPNTGSMRRTWYWGYGASSSAIKSHLRAKSTRLADLEPYAKGTSRRYAYVSVKNSGGDRSEWYWWLNRSASSLAAELDSKGARLIDLERLPDGRYSAVAVVGAGSDRAAWWWRLSFTSLAAVNEHAAQFAARPVDVESYVVDGSPRYDAVFIDNANASTGRIRGIFAGPLVDPAGRARGIFEAYVKPVGGAPVVSLNAGRRAEVASALKALHLLHAMRQVQAGADALSESFVFYNYPSTAPWPNNSAANACPNPADETSDNQRSTTLEDGLDLMMSNSDNRTTRGVVLRYGGFEPLNRTAVAVGLRDTVLRHNIGCATWVVGTSKYSAALRNDTTAADLARIYEDVWSGRTLAGTPRDEFLESANPSYDATAGLQSVINSEAEILGKSGGIAQQFGTSVRRWNKPGGYTHCAGAADGSCGGSVTAASDAGILRLPIKVAGKISYRTYVFANLISEVPVSCDTCPGALTTVASEMFREEIRSALQTWPDS